MKPVPKNRVPKLEFFTIHVLSIAPADLLQFRAVDSLAMYRNVLLLSQLPFCELRKESQPAGKQGSAGMQRKSGAVRGRGCSTEQRERGRRAGTEPQSPVVIQPSSLRPVLSKHFELNHSHGSNVHIWYTVPRFPQSSLLVMTSLPLLRHTQ